MNNSVNKQSSPAAANAKAPVTKNAPPKSATLAPSPTPVEAVSLTRSQRFNEARNAVQAQIEKMFQEASNAKVNSSSDGVSFNMNKAVINVRSADPPSKPLTNKVAVNKQDVPLPPIPVQTSPVAKPVPAAQPGANTNQYKVDYLGSIALPGRATSLDSLQFPLRDLYGKYRR